MGRSPRAGNAECVFTPAAMSIHIAGSQHPIMMTRSTRSEAVCSVILLFGCMLAEMKCMYVVIVLQQLSQWHLNEDTVYGSLVV